MSSGRLLEVELHVFSPSQVYDPPDDLTFSAREVLTLAANGKYSKCLNYCCGKIDFLKFKTNDDVSTLEASVEKYMVDSDESDLRFQKEIELFCCTVSCLQLFVASNWTGPAADLASTFPDLSCNEILNEKIMQLLEIDGESVYTLIASPILLYICKTVFRHLEFFRNLKTTAWWCLRYISIYQQLLSERSPTLHTLSKSIIEDIPTHGYLRNEKYRSYAIQLNLESGLLQLYCYQYKDAEKQLETANNLAGLQCSLGGALGVRTRFQENPLPQLRVNVSRTRDEAIQTKVPKLSPIDLPKALPLGDDTLLEAVKFTAGDESPQMSMTAEDQALVLMRCTKMQKASPSHKLRDEQILCYVEYLLSDPKCWSVHIEALRTRSILQRHKRRTVERSMMQLETLVRNVSPKNGDLPDDVTDATVKRLALFYSVWPKPKWVLQKELASLFESLGVLSSALEIYRRLHMWEEAISCLIRTGRGHDAELLIREQLAVKETPNLYCLLGDVLQDPDQYEKAWDVSQHRSSRAMRSLGAYKASKKLYAEAVDCFEKSLAINYLQIGAWFNMGCAALACEEYEKAAKSFQKCVGLNWDNFEAWTNLSTSFVRCNKKNQAFLALREGIKCNFGRWELWENFLFVSADTGHFQEVVNAYNRLLDLKDKYVDISVLKILVRAITEDMPDANELPASKVKLKTLELFGRLTSKITSNWEVWGLYAQLLGNGTLERNSDQNNKALSYLQKALRSALNIPSWGKEVITAKRITSLCMNIIEACRHCQQQQLGELEKNQIKALVTSTRLSINSVKSKLRMQEKLLLKEESRREFGEMAAKLEDELSSLNCLI